MITSSRAVAIAAAVPPLRHILLRALSTSAAVSGGGPRTVQPRPAVRPRLSFKNARPSRVRAEKRGSVASSSSSLASLQTVKKVDSWDDTSPQEEQQDYEEEEAPEVPEPRTERENQFGFVYHPRAKPFRPNAYPVPNSALGEDLAEPKSFDSFGLHEGLAESLVTRFGSSGRTTFIQSLSLNHFCTQTDAPSGSRTLLGAETGSGKTFAYLLPVLHHLKATETEEDLEAPSRKDMRLLPRAIVLQPTHELTRQSTAMAKSVSHNAKLSILGMSNSPDGGVKGRRGHVDVLFGTGAMTRRMMGIRKPGMQVEEGYHANEWVGVDKLDWLVIDEADILLSKDFRAETLLMIQKITAARPNVNIILCTATFPPALLNLLKSHEFLLKTPFTHLLSPKLHKLPRNLEARFVPRSRGDLFSDVVQEVRRVQTEDAIKRNHMIAQGNPVEKSKFVVFCNLDSRVRALSELLEEKGHPNLTWTKEGVNRKPGSTGALQSFLLDPREAMKAAMNPGTEVEDDTKVEKEKEHEEPRILITTGILSRGLDFSPSVSTVFLVDQPKDILDFMHRAGRAGRAGRKGRVVIFGGTQGRQAEDGKLGSVMRDMVHKHERSQQALWLQKREERLQMIRDRQKEIAVKTARREGDFGILKKDDVTRANDGKEYKRPNVGWKREAPGYGKVQTKLKVDRMVKKYGKDRVRKDGWVIGGFKKTLAQVKSEEKRQNSWP